MLRREHCGRATSPARCDSIIGCGRERREVSVRSRRCGVIPGSTVSLNRLRLVEWIKISLVASLLLSLEQRLHCSVASVAAV